MQKVNLNLIPGGVRPVVNVSQYDEGRQFQLAIYNGSASYDLTGKTVIIEVGKRDGNGCAYGVSDLVNNIPVVAVTGNIVTITTPKQMTAVAGQNNAELKISNSSSEIGTLNFILDCEQAALSPDTPLSATEIPAIEAAGWDAVEHYPYIDEITNHWMVWDISLGQYVDTHVGAGGGGVTDYNDLSSRPQINGVLLTGNRSAGALGLATDSAMTGASAGAAGSKGLVPAPAAGDQGKFLRGDGTWQNETSSLSGLTDTDISAPTDGQVLKYDSANSKWVNGNGGGGGASTLAGLSDTDIDTPTNGQPLTYDNENSKWVNGGVLPTANGGTGNADGYIRIGNWNNHTIGQYATVDGHETEASAYCAHSEGYRTVASGDRSHAEGTSTTASGGFSHSEGVHTVAGSYATHAGGYYTEAGYNYQTVIGKYNKNASDSLFEIGNGTADTLAGRSNAIAVKDDGRIVKGDSDAYPAASNLAPVEMTRTMSVQRAAGKYVYVAADDQFYKVTTTISASGTLTPGTNATAVSIGEVLEQLNSDIAEQVGSITPVTGHTLSVAFNRKRAGICEIAVTFSGETISAAEVGYWKKLATASLKPEIDIYAPVYNGNNATYLCEGRIDTSGNIYIYPQEEISSGIYIVIQTMFFTND